MRDVCPSEAEGQFGIFKALPLNFGQVVVAMPGALGVPHELDLVLARLREHLSIKPSSLPCGFPPRELSSFFVRAARMRVRMP
jgi:hypothetical protein